MCIDIQLKQAHLAAVDFAKVAFFPLSFGCVVIMLRLVAFFYSFSACV